MQANLYLSNGYVDIHSILQMPYTFIFIVGGRGTGKTYGALKEVLDYNIKFMYTRRTQTQADMINKPEFSPFKKLNSDLNLHVLSFPLTKSNSGFYHCELNAKGKPVPSGNPIGYTSALSTISNMRGFDASDVELWIYDEFIPEPQEKPIKHECEAFLNAYETMNRNRELEGKPPIKVLALSNSNDIGNPLFIGLNLVSVCEQMKRKGQQVYTNKHRSLAIIDLLDSQISKKKANTVLYRFAGKTQFANMALKNEFAGLEDSCIKGQIVDEYKPLVNVGEIAIYKHKSEKRYYVTEHKSGSATQFNTDETDLARYRRCYSYLWVAYMENRILFKNKLCQLLFEQYS